MAILEILTSLRCKVTFVADNLEHRQPYVAQLQQRGVEVLFAPVRALDRRAADASAAREFDVIVMARHYIAVEAHRRGARVRAASAASCSTRSTCISCASERLAELEGSALGDARRRAPSATRSSR